MMFWTLFVMFQCTAMYVATFVAQYTGAGRPHRVGPAVWQGLYFSIIAGLLILALAPFSASIVAVADHSAALQVIEATFFVIYAGAATRPDDGHGVELLFRGAARVEPSCGSTGPGWSQPRCFDYLLIFGKFGFPAWGSRRFRLGHRDGHVDIGRRRSWIAIPKTIPRRVLAPVGLAFRVEPVRAIDALRLAQRLAVDARHDRLQAFILLAAWFSDTAMGATSFAITINNVASSR